MSPDSGLASLSPDALIAAREPASVRSSEAIRASPSGTLWDLLTGGRRTDVLLDRLLPLGEQKYSINQRGELNKSGLYNVIVSFLSDGNKHKRNYKMGRAKNIGKRLASYKTCHPEGDCIRLCACICIPFGVATQMTSKNSAMLVNLFENIVKQNLIHAGGKQIRSTEWFGKVKNYEIMRVNLSLFRQAHTYLCNSLPATPITLHLYTYRLWKGSSMSSPLLDVNKAYKDPAKSSLDVAMYEVGYRGDGNADVVEPAAFGDFIKVSLENKKTYESLDFTHVEIEDLIMP